MSSIKVTADNLLLTCATSSFTDVDAKVGQGHPKSSTCDACAPHEHLRVPLVSLLVFI
jgi:hypothetical protein